MRLRDFCLLLFATLVLVSQPPARAANTDQPYSKRVEIRAVWMDRDSIPKTEQGIKDLIRSYADAGINVVHPEVVSNGYSAYPSAYYTRQDLWNGLDVLKIIIREAHKRHIEVHPWVWVFRAGNVNDRGGILKSHPDWVAKDRNGGELSVNQGYWLCPSMPEVRSFLLNAYIELAQKYDIDGLELDYIRFENESPVPYCYNASCRVQFKDKYGLDPMDIQPFTKPIVDWQLWREDLVNTFVQQVSAELKKARPGIQISAAVGAIPDSARVDLLQDWGHWADNKWVDFLAPMDYTPDVAYFTREVSAAQARVGGKVPLAPGLGIFLANTMDPMLREVQAVRSMGAEGVTLFATAYIGQKELSAFSQGPFREKASLPVKSPIDGAKRLMRSAYDKLSSGSSTVDIANAGLDLSGAQDLLKCAAYRQTSTGYVPPLPPPIFIPERVQPIPQADVPYTQTPPQIDGRLDDAAWQKAATVHITTTNLGAGACRPTDVLLAYDSQNLYIAFRAFDPNPSAVTAKITQHDDAVFYDDSVEMLLSIPTGNPPFANVEQRPYYHFAMNAIGTKFEQKVFDASWNGIWQGAAGKETNAWIAEIAIPFASIGVQNAVQNQPWRANFCRNALLSTGTENSCWSETYGSYHTPSRFGVLIPVQAGQ